MKNRLFLFPISLLLLTFVLDATALEIPLDNAVINGKKEAANIAFLDIEKIFDEHPMTQRLKEEFKNEVEKGKQELEVIEKEIDTLNTIHKSTSTEIDQLKIKLELLENVKKQTETLQTSTTIQTQAEPKKDEPVLNIETLKKQIEEKEKELKLIEQNIAEKNSELRKLKIKKEKELVKLEKKQTEKVLGDLYEILSKIALNENLTIIIDKNHVLYGQPTQDITEKVRDRLRGR